MDKSNKSQLKTAIIIVSLLFLLFFILVFFYYQFYVKNELKNPDSLKINYFNKQEIEIKNKLPVSDSLGKNYNGKGSEEGIQEFREFTINNNSNIDREFIILLDKQYFDSNSIDEKYIKIYLTDEKDNPIDGFSSNPIPTFNSFDAYSKVITSKVIYKGKIEKKTMKKYKLRSWLSDSYVIPGNEELFRMKLVVE